MCDLGLGRPLERSRIGADFYVRRALDNLGFLRVARSSGDTRADFCGIGDFFGMRLGRALE